MLPPPIYYALLLLSGLYVLARGGMPERTGLAIIAAGSVLSSVLMAPPAQRYRDLETGVLWVDAVVAVGLVVLALRSDRFWTLWVAALQLVGIGAHFVKLGDPGIARIGYSVVMSLWAYPMLLLVAAGAYRRGRGFERALDRGNPPQRWHAVQSRKEHRP
jgi:hypothetical protein